MNLNLDERLRAILDAIGSVGTLADVGCDHGKVSVGALLEGKAKKVISIDISPESLRKTVALATEFGVKIIPMQSDGLTGVSDNVDLAVIAGLGGNEIVKIITEAGKDRCDFLCVAHQDEWVLRSFLSGRFKITMDSVVKCGRKFYSIIKAERSEKPTIYTRSEMYCGLDMPASESYAEMLMERRRRLSGITQRHNVPEGELTELLAEVEKECTRLKI